MALLSRRRHHRQQSSQHAGIRRSGAGPMNGSQTTKIGGVVVKPLKRVVNERGWLLEVQRNDDAEHIGFGQAYVTATRPGIVRAWYRHRRQIDNISPVTGLLRVV